MWLFFLLLLGYFSSSEYSLLRLYHKIQGKKIETKGGQDNILYLSALVWSGFPSFLSYFLFTLVTTLLRSPSLNWNGTMVPYLRLTKIQNWAKQSSMVNNKTHPRTFTRKMRYMNHQNNYGRAK